jgi:hypothetical protein
MKVRFETTCSGCRIKNRPHLKGQQCRWIRYGYSGHHYQWRYIITVGDQRLVTSMWFGTRERAQQSADRKLAKLCATIEEVCAS